MKKTYKLGITLAICLALAGFVQAAPGGDDIAAHKACGYCSMDRGMYNFSRMLIEYDDGSVAPFCSLRCAAVNLSTNIDKTPLAIKVGDFEGKQLIDAEKAFWVIGGTKPGVMSKRGKWAFEQKDAAEKFMETNQGKLVSFQEALKAAYEDMADDTKMIRERRKAKRMAQAAAGGQDQAKRMAQAAAGGQGQPAPAHHHPAATHDHGASAAQKEKCPVCGMNVAMFADWNATIRFKDATSVVFDGAKDMFKYYLNVQKYHAAKNTDDITAVSVKDYYSKQSIDARQAFFVIWSDKYGPMGHEPIPFEKETDAKKFLNEHKGKKVVRFAEVTPKLLHHLDNP